jgi:hypothetical protein
VALLGLTVYLLLKERPAEIPAMTREASVAAPRAVDIRSGTNDEGVSDARGETAPSDAAKSNPESAHQ